MINRRLVVGVLASGGLIALSGAAVAQGKSPQQGDLPRGSEQKGKKAKKHVDGRQALGGKIKQNGRHKLPKAGTAEIEIEVKGGKVANLIAQHPKKGALPVKKVKSKQKLADAAPSIIRASSDGALIQLAQYFDWYYAYWYEEDDSDYYYWFTADEVYVDDSWVEYY